MAGLELGVVDVAACVIVQTNSDAADEMESDAVDEKDAIRAARGSGF